MLSKPSAEDELSILVFAISEIFVLQKRKQLCEFMPHHLLFNSYFSALPPPFNSGIYGTHTHLQTTKAYYYYTSLAVFRDISSRIPFWL